MTMVWEDLPEVVLGNIFSHLGLFDKLNIKEICSSWQSAVSRPEIWHTFVYSDDYVWNELIQGETTVSNLSKFHQIKIDLLECVKDYGKYFQQVYVYLNGDASFEIFSEISRCCSNVQNIRIAKSRNSEIPNDFRKTIHNFLEKNVKLTEISIEGVNLKPVSNNDPLPIGIRHSQKVQKLALVNSFPSYSLSSLMYLVHLRELTINPHSLHHSLINHLAGASLTTLNIVANRRTKEFFFENLCEQQWKDLSHHKNLHVYIYMGVSYDWAQNETLLKPNIPLVTLVYRKCMWLQYDKLCVLLPHYTKTLEEFVDYSVNEGSYIFAGEAPFSDRQDRSIIKIVQGCPKLHTLAVKEKLSSSTILLLAFSNPNLRNLYIRDDMISYKFDIPEDIVVPAESLEFILQNWEQENFTAAMSHVLSREWHSMSKTEYISTLQSKYSSSYI